MSADSGDAAATVDGIRLAELIGQLPLSRGSVFELIKALGITTQKGAGPGGKGRVAWVSSDDADRLTTASARVHRGEVRIQDLQGLATLPRSWPGWRPPRRGYAKRRGGNHPRKGPGSW